MSDLTLTDFVKKLSVPIITSGSLFALTALLGVSTGYSDAAIFFLVGGGFIFRELVGFTKYKGKERIDGKTVIVTGANTGIGAETAKYLADRGARVILACRDTVKGESVAEHIKEFAENENVVCKKLDLTSFKSIREFSKDIIAAESQVDILINNAGVMMCPKMLTEDGLEMQIGTNHFGHFLLTNLLLDKMKASAPSRIINVSSTAHKLPKGINFEDINSEKSYDSMAAYGQSKLANILHARHLSKLLEGTGVTTYSLHPGGVSTELMRHFSIATHPVGAFFIAPIRYYFLKTPFEGAQTTIRCAVDPTLEKVSAKYYSDCKEKSTSPAGRDDEAAKRLWDVSVEITDGKKAK